MVMVSGIISRMGRLRLPMLSLITNRHLFEGDGLVNAVTDAVAGGVMMVQLREKDLPAAVLLDLARRLRAVTRGKSLFVLNDRLDVAQAADADGVHLPENGLPVNVARWLLGRHVLIGRSVHSVEAAIEAERGGADYVQLGTIFESVSHPDQPPVGVELIKQVRKVVNIPVIAVGGITAANAVEVIEAGAHGVAVISAILSAEDKKAAAQELREVLSQAWSRRIARPVHST